MLTLHEMQFSRVLGWGTPGRVALLLSTLLVSILLAACAGVSGAEHSTKPDSTTPSLGEPGLPAGFPSLNELPPARAKPARGASKQSLGILLGDDALLQSGNASADKTAHTMDLSCQPGGMSWAIYAFPGDGLTETAFRLNLNLNGAAPKRFWVGHADYYNKRWGWSEVDDSDGSEDLYVEEGEGSYSPANTAYIAILIYNSLPSGMLTATLSDLELYTANERGDWWCYGRNPQHCAYSPHSGPDKYAEAWLHPYPSYYVGSPVQAADGTLYICSADGQLHAIAPDGSLSWMAPVPDYMRSNPAVGRDGAIYVGGGNSRLYAYNSDGSDRWNVLLQQEGEWETPDISAAIVIGERGTIYVACGDSYLYAVNPNGTVAWSHYVRCAGLYNPAPALGPDGTIYYGSLDSRMYALNPDGSERWRFPTDTDISSTPAVAPDGAIVFTSGHSIYVLNPDGTERNSYTNNGMYLNSEGPAIGPGGMIYFGGMRPGVSEPEYGIFAFNPNCSLAWFQDLGGGHVDSRVAVDATGTIYAGEFTNYPTIYFRALNPDGSSKWNYTRPISGGAFGFAPAIGFDGTVYVAAGTGGLEAIGPGI